MRKRIISMLLALVAVLGLFPTAASAASSEQEALGEVDIYNSGKELSYLSINGRIRTLIYTYYNYTTDNGQVREIPAYCVNPNTKGVPQTVAAGESIAYLANEKSSDPKIMGIVANGYPTRGLAELKLENKYHAYYATKMALWCYILPNWDINDLQVNPTLTGVELQRAQSILAAAKNIYTRGVAWDEVKAPQVTCTPDRSVAYDVTIDGKAYKQQVFTFWSKSWIRDHAVELGFTDAASAPAGARVVNMDNKDITILTTEPIGDGYAGKFKVLYPLESVQGKTGSVQLSFHTTVYKLAIFYAICAEVGRFGELQNYMVDTDPTTAMQLSAFSNFSDSGAVEAPETGLEITKLEEGTDLPLEGAVFSITGPDGEPIGSFSSDFSGQIIIPLTLAGVYTVTEEIAPAYHLLPEKRTQQVTVRYGEVAKLTFYDALYGSLRVQKISDTGEYLPGVMVQIKHIESGVTYSKETGPAGVAVFSEIKPGAYEVRELAGIPGWQADTDTVKTVTVAAGDTSEVSITNKELPGLRIIKYERGSMEVMPDVSFEIFRDGESLGVFLTDEFGEILLSNCKPGTYLAVERDTGGDSHVLETTPQEVELHAGDGIKQLVFFNERLPGIHLVKVDARDLSKPIANARFRIEAVDGSWGPAEYTTQADGTIDLSKLPVGAFVVTELECPGYVVDEAQRIIHLDGNETAQFVFTNSKLPSLNLYKESADGTPLGGVTFRLAKIEDGSHYLDRTTAVDGTITWEGLEPGVYSLTETSTVSDHILDPKEHHVELFPGQDSTICLQNDKRPNLTIHKNDADDGSPVPGTVYLVKTADGHSVAEVETGADGTAVVPNLLPGVYQVIEKSVPSPYLLDAEPQLVTLFPNRDRSVYFENHKAPTIEILKQDSITHEPLANVRFQVWYASNNTATGELNDLGVFTTDENGRIELTGPGNGLKDGWFRVKELEPPTGYSIKDSDTQEAFVQAGKGHTFLFENTPLSALVVWKYDSVSGSAVEGAVFQVRYLGGTSGTGGTVIGTYKTGPSGAFTVSALKRGTYIIEELASDSSHVIDTAPQTVFISGEEQDVIQVYFGNSPKGSLLVKKVSASDGAPLSDVEFLVTTSDGAVVGDANGKFTTDSAGTFLVSGIAPGTTLVVKETHAKPGYLLDDTPQTAVVKAGQAVTLEFRNQPKGNLIVQKLSSADKKTPLEGVQFKITYADGTHVDTEGGKLSSNGLYFTDANGQIVLSGLTGTVVVTEVATIPGYTIHEETRTQTVAVNPNDTQTLYFYNDPVGGLDLVKVSESDRSERIPNTTFEIRRAGDDALVDTVTTDRNGHVFVPLADGAYYAVEIKAGKGYRRDDTPIYFTVEDGKTTSRTVTNKALSGIIIHKIDSVSGEGIYGVKFVLYDSGKNPIGEYTSDDEGYVYIDDIPGGASGRMYLRELEAADGYTLDKEYKTVYVKPGKTVEIEWENTAVTGQVQIYKYAAEYNSVTGTAAGAPLAGAVYEISNARSGKVVDYITTDARGVAASKPLPLTRYKIVEVTAPAYWQVDPTIHDVTLEYPGQIIKLSAFDKPAALGVSITKRGNAEVLAGNQMRYDITVANTSNVDLESFYWHDRIPTDAARATVLSTGTYSARLNYRVLYKTNYNGTYQVLASNLLTTNNYTFALNAIPMQAGEVVTDVYFDFGKVPVGFQSVTGPTLSVMVLGTAVNGYQLVNRADVGGKYQGTWQTAQANWVTIIRKYGTTPTLPKTGY